MAKYESLSEGLESSDTNKIMTSLQEKVYNSYYKNQDRIKDDSDVLISSSDILGKRGYSHVKRISSFIEKISPNYASFSDEERSYVQGILNVSRRYISKNKKKIKNSNEALDLIEKAKRNLHEESPYHSRIESNPVPNNFITYEEIKRRENENLEKILSDNGNSITLSNTLPAVSLDTKIKYYKRKSTNLGEFDSKRNVLVPHIKPKKSAWRGLGVAAATVGILAGSYFLNTLSNKKSQGENYVPKTVNAGVVSYNVPNESLEENIFKNIVEIQEQEIKNKRRIVEEKAKEYDTNSPLLEEIKENKKENSVLDQIIENKTTLNNKENNKIKEEKVVPILYDSIPIIRKDHTNLKEHSFESNYLALGEDLAKKENTPKKEIKTNQEKTLEVITKPIKTNLEKEIISISNNPNLNEEKIEISQNNEKTSLECIFESYEPSEETLNQDLKTNLLAESRMSMLGNPDKLVDEDCTCTKKEGYSSWMINERTKVYEGKPVEKIITKVGGILTNLNQAGRWATKNTIGRIGKIFTKEKGDAAIDNANDFFWRNAPLGSNSNKDYAKIMNIASLGLLKFETKNDPYVCEDGLAGLATRIGTHYLLYEALDGGKTGGSSNKPSGGFEREGGEVSGGIGRIGGAIQ